MENKHIMENIKMDNDTSEMLAKINTEGMIHWSENNKKDFIKTFNDRILVSRYVLEQTASLSLDAALDKKYIGLKHQNKLKEEYSGKYNNSLMSQEVLPNYNSNGLLGGRSVQELDNISKDRSKEILNQLPPLKQAVQVISADLAKKISERDNIVAKGKELTEKLVDLSQPISMSEVDQKMTISEFRAMVKGIENKRTKLVNEINELTKEGLELDKDINKALYAGLPGLSDAVVLAIKSMMEKSKALSQLGRRVGEQVMFGNSDVALELLRGFEQDETKLSEEVSTQLGSAMSKLKEAIAMSKKKLKK